MKFSSCAGKVVSLHGHFAASPFDPQNANSHVAHLVGHEPLVWLPPQLWHWKALVPPPRP